MKSQFHSSTFNLVLQHLQLLLLDPQVKKPQLDPMIIIEGNNAFVWKKQDVGVDGQIACLCILCAVQRNPTTIFWCSAPALWVWVKHAGAARKALQHFHLYLFLHTLIGACTNAGGVGQAYEGHMESTPTFPSVFVFAHTRWCLHQHRRCGSSMQGLCMGSTPLFLSVISLYLPLPICIYLCSHSPVPAPAQELWVKLTGLARRAHFHSHQNAHLHTLIGPCASAGGGRSAHFHSLQSTHLPTLCSACANAAGVGQAHSGGKWSAQFHLT
eukprot:1159708-Pelagomonas_calceolata.AAC.3